MRALSLALEELAVEDEDSEERTPKVLGSIDALEVERNADRLAEIAAREYRARRSRERYFDRRLFGEPAWDILIDLFIQQSSGKTVSVTSAAIASQVPVTTALRHLAALQKAGLVERMRSAADARVKLLRLTKEGYVRIGSWLMDRTTPVVRRR
ncbi:MAG TPA: MarR family transcriptional regulator [Croceibacterium sp.]|nr:MarR family transcriptional regulator [Croceibacterium sp.]